MSTSEPLHPDEQAIYKLRSDLYAVTADRDTARRAYAEVKEEYGVLGREFNRTAHWLGWWKRAAWLALAIAALCACALIYVVLSRSC